MSATRLAGMYATFAAAASLLIAPLLALSYFGTSEGAEDLEIGSVSAWAEPARDLTGGLLTWASPDRVYSTYLQLLALLFPAVFLCARAIRTRQSESGGRFERSAWRIALAGYGLAGVGIVAAAAVLVGGDPKSDALNIVFLALLVPGMLVTGVGSTLLGIALLRTDFTPRLTAWLLALALPLLIVGSGVLGHNSLGMVPIFIAWGVAGWHLWRSEPASIPNIAAA